MITPQAALNRLIDGNELFYDEMLALMRQIMRGELSPAQTAAILIGLRVKVESVSEIAAAATVMREFATHVPVSDRRHLVDTCGTGGDKSHTFNISTTSAFVAAAAGARVAKHGGRSVSSSSGSADVLELLGVNLQLTPEQVGQCLDEIGLGFMFAPNHHSAMKHVAPIRKELGARTIFNILGPLTNPAAADHQLMGVFHPDLVGIQSRVLKMLGSRHVMIVHGCDGLDELTLSGPSMVAELKNGEILEYELEPGEFGFPLCELKDLRADTAAQSRDRLLAVLDGQPGPARDIVLLNAGAAIYTADIAPSLADGVTMAREALDSGKAKQKLQQLIALSRKLGG
ncbi:anthranilate phosphoribosyltransferase [Chromobacterium violaceum]|uniref:Anthranilate phosphoribosyltransferase n=2 Tax=Chromobacterium violaceum TaxID=536 RepID=TRPD_CHRVO|nr:anthranilate phosphoribosyltransferase [Chromobacterium violaceum]Q7NW17.1 RecName: Full=Anthranilate phosphoribosyltransferase [Chromobacterium violaceum ATCC 12472]AAQ59846.1 anthranilate phosphoribosyltransferase [Chromobacterium violaceum ATCC 12472]ATP28681.1 anthranilate phosphoribosyltransferase [Chromobacterium violaceum]ATP32591.1 anthranilate phosphoribosyltransferase [Chromobacterium violaceum]KJH66296.1 anthranilate phosphoribosyltransferase [Chromobacterium violaceum]MCD049424